MDTFETERIKGKRLQLEDLDTIKSFHKNSKVMEGLGGVRTEENTETWLQKNLDHWDKHSFGIWILYSKEEDVFIGRGGLRHTAIENADEIELAYAFLPDYWGKGLATELSFALLQIAKDLGFSNITSCAIPTNAASIRVMEKAGFTYERDFIYEDEGPCVLYRKELK